MLTGTKKNIYVLISKVNAYSFMVVAMKKIFIAFISLALVVLAFVALSSRPDEAVQVVTGGGQTYEPVNIIQFIRSLFQ